MKHILGLLLAALTTITGYTQNSSVSFRHLTVQDGLSRNWVKCFLQDREDYLWIGTADGLNKYDGYNFKTYKYSTSGRNTINSNNINTIFEDSNNRLWFGTQAGLNLYNRKTDQIIPINSINNYICSIYELSADKLLVGSAGGLFVFNTIDHSAIQVYNDINIEDMVVDRFNNCWLATLNGLLLVNLSDLSYKKVYTEHCMAVSNGIIWSLLVDSMDRLWIGTNRNGLILLENPNNSIDQFKFRSFTYDPSNSSGISKGGILSLLEDNHQNLWIGVENGGLNQINLNDAQMESAKFQHLYHNPSDNHSLSDNSIHSLYLDHQNTMWVGTYGGGISFYNPLLQRFEHHTEIPGEPVSINDNHVNVIFEEDKYLWLGTEGGLNRYNKETVNFDYFTNDFKNPRSIGSNAIWDIFRDSRNNLWVGTWEGGLNLLNEKTGTFTQFVNNDNDPESISGNNIFDISEDIDGNLWIALMGGGLNRFNYSNSTFTKFKEDFNANSISCNWVNAVMAVDNKNLWISTTEAVDLFNTQTGHFTTFTNDSVKPNSIGYNGAICFYQDSKKNIWVGTSNGLNLFRKSDSSFFQFGTDNGISNNTIKAICEDTCGNLWFSTKSGITEFLKGVSLPELPVFKNYDVSDGMQGGEFNARAVFVNNKGHIYFGSTNGYYVFNPYSISDNPFVPNTVITKLLINNKPVGIGDQNSPIDNDISSTKKLILNRKQSVFTLEFAALNLLAPENNQYAFYLEGFEINWNYVGSQRSATYTNLNPGKYTFHVRASNNDGLWNLDGYSMEIVILPAWWQTSMAKIIYALLILLAIYFFKKHTIISVNLRNKLWLEHLEKEKSEELNKLKHQFFTNVSHELRTPLTLILGPLKKLKSDSGNSEIIRTIYRNARRLKELVDQILDFSKIESHMMKLHPNSGDLVETMRNFLEDFAEYASQKYIQLIFKSSVDQCFADFDEDKMHKILSNLISNGIKNTQAGGQVSLNLSVNKEKESIKLEVCNNGLIIPQEHLAHIFDRFFSTSSSQSNDHTGIGLDLTKKLVELHGGTISVTSQEETGTIFTIYLPLIIHRINSGEIINSYGKSELGELPDCAMSEPVINSKKPNILVVDDNVEMCTYIESILNESYNVLKETQPVECVNHLGKFMPDLIISDVMMPGMTGFELCSFLKNDLRFSHIPIILLTAKATTPDKITGFETGADDYIYKPFHEDLLRVRVANLIRKKDELRRYFISNDGILNTNIQVTSLDLAFTEQILRIINENYADTSFGVYQIIDQIGMSRSIFYKKFKALSDQSINELIKNFRLSKAAGLIRSGKFSISQVAYDCGFSDPAYFSKVFKEHYKVTPKEFNSKNADAEIPD